MGTRRPESDDGERSESRFAMSGSISEEGGVRSASVPAGSGSSIAGMPGPEERLLDISEIARTLGMWYSHRIDIPPFTADNIEFAAPLKGQMTLTNTGSLLLLRGHVATKLRLECVRCLATTVQDVETDLEEEFDLVSTRNAFRQEEVQAVDDDTPASVIQGNVLHLDELLRQSLLVAAPLKPLCREDCPGLRETAFEDEAAPAAAEPTESPLRRLGELWAERENGGSDRKKE